MSTTKTRPTMHKIPVYDVRLVKSRRPLMLAEPILPDSGTSARALHALIGLTDREHFVALFLNARHQVTGAHIAAIGGQHTAGIDLRATLRAAIVACASAIILGHYVPRTIMSLLLPMPFCSRTRDERRSSPGKRSRMAT